MDKLVESLDEQGNKLSPVLPLGKKNYLIDIDGTVGEDIPNEESERMATAEAVSYTHLTLPTILRV